MRTRTRRFVVGFLAAFLFGVTANAQSTPPSDRSFSPQLFHPPAGPDEFLTIEPALPLPHLNYSFGLWLNYARNPFTIFSVTPGGAVGGARAELIQNALAADLVGAVGLLNWLQVSLALPMVLWQDGQDFNFVYNGVPGTARAPADFALADPVIGAKARLWGASRGVNLSLAPYFVLPLSQVTGDSFGGDHTVAAGAHVLAGYEGDRWRVGGKLGFLYRGNTSHFFSTTVGHELSYGVAGAYDAMPRRLTVVAEVYGRTDLSGSEIPNIDANPLELDAGAKVRILRSLQATFGLGTGLVRGLGAPLLRVIGGLTFAPDRRDRDHDGVPDIDDKCPDKAEDRDGFQDNDGCPDLDNDADGIPDANDRCPSLAEDFDQFQDEDGCPDVDNDGDGVPDIKDSCPSDKEDGKAPRPSDGCPADKVDTDEDGIPDVKDKCPLEPEDMDGFEDADGCPDVDNDGDGIPDPYDKCPNQPEDLDGFEDDDGCPDPDNDRDGVLDKLDKCPKEAETINGIDDEDGCPDKGPSPKVQIVGEEIVILEKVFFDTGKATIQPRSFNLLEQVSTTIKAHPEVKQVRIEGHTDSRGSAPKNKQLSQNRAEAVRAFLVKHGVVEGRLTAEGFGQERPVADNKTSRGREANRRVEFHITEQTGVQPKAEPPKIDPNPNPAVPVP